MYLPITLKYEELYKLESFFDLENPLLKNKIFLLNCFNFQENFAYLVSSGTIKCFLKSQLTQLTSTFWKMKRIIDIHPFLIGERYSAIEFNKIREAVQNQLQEGRKRLKAASIFSMSLRVTRFRIINQ